MTMCTLYKTKVQRAVVYLCDLRHKSHIFQPQQKINGINKKKQTNKTGLYQVNSNVILLRQIHNFSSEKGLMPIFLSTFLSATTT